MPTNASVDPSKLTFAVLDVLAGVPGDMALSVLISALVTAIHQVAGNRGEQVAIAIGKQIADEYATASAMLAEPRRVN